MFDRRMFLKSSGLAIDRGRASSPTSSSGWRRRARFRGAASKRVLVAIFQRGAVDGLNVLVPYGEKSLLRARVLRSRFRGRARARTRRSILDGFFGLHPSLAPLLPYFKDRSAAFVHAVGTPDPTRSHFDAQDFMESGTPGVKSTRRRLPLPRARGRRTAKASPLRAVSLTPGMPRILAGSRRRHRHDEPRAVRHPRRPRRRADLGVLRIDVRRAPSPARSRRRAKESFDAVQLLQSADPAKIAPENGADYPRSPFGNALEADRAAHQGGRGARGRVHRRRRLGHARGRGRRAGPARQPPARFRQAIAAFARTSARAWPTSRSSRCPSSAAP